MSARKVLGNDGFKGFGVAALLVGEESLARGEIYSSANE